MISNRTALLGAIGAIALGSAAALAVPAQPALAVAVESPAGGKIRLEYREGQGWLALAAEDVAQPARVALADTSGTTRPLAVFLDRPSAGTFVYLPEQGWKFAGRSDAAEAVAAAPRTVGQALTIFVDGPTGFVFTYVAEKGWSFAGKVGDMRL